MKFDSIGDWVRTGYSANVTPDIDGEEVTLFQVWERIERTG